MPTEQEGLIKAVFAYFISPLKLPVTLSQASLKKGSEHNKNLKYSFLGSGKRQKLSDLILT